MSQVQITVPDYLRPPCESLWRWTDHGDAVVWCYVGESTAAFAPQLASILKQLRVRLGGLPPLTSVLAVIDSCSNAWTPQACMSRITWLSMAANGDSRRSSPSTELVSSILNWLGQLHRLPSESRSDVESQVELLSYAFQDLPESMMEATDVVAQDVIACVSVFVRERDPAWVESAAPINSRIRAKRAFDTLRLAAQHPVNAQAIQLWRETQVASMPSPAPVDVPTPRNPIAQSLKELSTDEQWSAVARSAIAAASMLSLPRRPSDPDQLPIGGVSDVSNRGQPERLLITELAQDPMVMLARIANGQALYLRRETPPGPSPDIRPVFLESGIRTWGTTRLKIASLGMAIAAAEERRGESSAELITVAGEQYFDEDFTTTAGMIAHLRRTETDEHPGSAIASYLKAIAEAEELFADPIVVVSAATDADARFRRALDPLPDGILVARVERDHTVTLLRRTALGDEALQSLSLDPIEPSQKANSSANTLVRTKESSVALFLDLDPCPLLFTNNLDGAWFTATTAPGLFTITRDKRLLWFGGRGQGGVQLIDHLPHTKVLAYEKSEHRVAMVVGDEEHFLIEADAVNGCVEVVPLSMEDQNVGTYQFDSGSLFHVGQQVRLFDRHSGAILDRVPSGGSHIGPAIFASGLDVTLLAEEAGKIVAHGFKADHSLKSQTFTLAARDSTNGLVLVSNYGTFVRFPGDEVTVVPAEKDALLGLPTNPPEIVYRSADDNMLVFRARYGQGKVSAVDLQNHKFAAINSQTPHRAMLFRFDREAYQLLKPQNYLSRFTAIEFGYDNSITFVKRNNKWKLEHVGSCDKLMLLLKPTGSAAVRYGFGGVQRLDRRYGRTRWSLRPITVNGNHIVADSRGLVHLRRGDDGTELTLMLHQDHVSGWASWGELFGDSYYLGSECVPPSETVLHWLEEFASQCSQSS